MRVRFALLVGIAVALVASAVASGSSTSAAKPGPGADVGSVAGAVVTDNMNSLKPGIAVAGPASAHVGKSRGSVVSMLAGYTVVTSGTLSNPNNAQSFGRANCPTGTVAFGGGVFGDSGSLFQNVNSSFPLVSGSVAVAWGGYIDNASGADSTFSVWVVCAKQPKYYSVVGASFTNAAGKQTYGSVQCPLNDLGKRLHPFGGGGVGSSSGLEQNINGSFPIGGKSRSWRVDMNNAGGAGETLSTYAVCGNRTGWRVVAGAAVINPANSQTSADVACPTGEVSVGGGEFSSSGSTSVNLNATWPVSSSSWRSYENNASGADASITPYVVCLL